MSDTIPGKRYGALYAWQDGDSWFYLPAAASPQRNADGRAQVTVVEAGGMLVLTLGTSLSASAETLAQAQTALAAEAGAAGTSVQLRPASATPRGARLIFTPEGGTPVELAKASPSPLPPYSAAFSAMLRGDQATAVSAAMKSGSGRLEVLYDLEISAARSVTARLIGDPGDTDDIEAAIAVGDLKFSLDADSGASEELKTDARRRVIAEATRLLRAAPRAAAETPSPFGKCHDDDAVDRANDGPDPTTTTETTATRTIDAHVTRTEPAPLAVRVGANVADWL